MRRRWARPAATASGSRCATSSTRSTASCWANERPPLSNERERQITAYHEAGHALAAVLTPNADPVLKVTTCHAAWRVA
ncbi:MAG: hypothetical protein HND48_00500 [Chloroflexi bacterium]|nr:hypothetical protein [Chloroflexota bacterium]